MSDCSQTGQSGVGPAMARASARSELCMQKATGDAPERECCVRRAVLVLTVPVEHALMMQHAAAMRLYELAVRIPELLARVEVCGRRLYVKNRLVRWSCCLKR